MLLDVSKLRARALPILTDVAHISAPFITTFLLIHLSAPSIANLGGSSLASQTMLLGREYYQTAITEPFLVLLPLAVHPTSAVLKRLLTMLPPSIPAPRPRTSLLALTGYTLLLLAPLHYLIHREYPTLPGLPIDSVGPAELDYEFVKTGLREWPLRTWAMYAGLAGAAALHMVDGSAIILNTRLAGVRFAARTRVPRLLVGLALITLPVITGLDALSKEPTMTFASMVGRYRAVFLESWIYRI